MAERTRVVVFSGGPAPPARLPDLADGAVVIGADAGAAHAHGAGLRVDHVVGDLDSLAPATLDEIVTAGAQVHRHAVDKDASDLDLALQLARRLDPVEVVVVAGWGGRTDHAFTELALLARPDVAALPLVAWYGTDRIVPITSASRELPTDVGQTVSIHAVGGPATVTTLGLRWALHDHRLMPGSTLGLSNVATGTRAEVTVSDGVALVFVVGVHTA